MIGANAQIGAAVADFFPRIGLSSFLGAEGVYSSGAWSDFALWYLALNAAGPIYDGGRLREIYNERQAFWDETVARYKQTVLVAFRETSDALVAQQTLALQRAALESQVGALQQSSQLALMRYDAGRASYFEVLEAQQQLFPAQDALARTIRDQLVSVINLYKALGGGWQGADALPPPEQPEPPPNVVPIADPAGAGG
jgi:multidrug efflux system outer membrane protein